MLEAACWRACEAFYIAVTCALCVQHDIEQLNSIVDHICQHNASRLDSGTLDPKVQSQSFHSAYSCHRSG